jgi:polyhydroxyalkanoate synthesis regulator phasin
VRFDSRQWREIDPASLPLYVSESENPGNEKGVLAAEVFLPHPLLSSGLCLVDTPGLGSVFEGNAATTRSFVPHIDAALVVLGADPPISGEELALVEEVARSVRRFLFVLNKADRLSEEERREARLFASQILERKLGRPVGPIPEISAIESLSVRSPTRELPVLTEALRALARDAGSDLVREAQERGIARLSARVLQNLSEQEDALRRPVEDSERRIEGLRRSVADAERAVADLGYLFTAEQERLSTAFADTREKFLASALPAATRQLEVAVAGSEADGANNRRRAASLAREVAQKTLEEWLAEVEPVAEGQYRGAVRRFVELANGFFERLAESDPSFAALLERRLEPDTGFRTARRFYFNDLFELAPGSAMRRIGDFTRSRERSLAAALRDAADYLRPLLEHNSTRVVNDLDERVLESRRRLEAEIRDRLREGLQSAVEALERARERQSEGSEAVARELTRIEELRRQIRQLQETTPASS